MVYETIFSSALGQLVLAFLLIFTLVFAVLQKSEILGKEKKQIDSLVSLAIALIVISVGSVLDFIQKIIPFMAIALVILLVFMILIGMLFKQGEFKIETWLKITIGVIVAIALVIAVLIFTKGWDYIKEFVSGNSSWTGNILLIVIIALAIVFAYFGTGKKD